MSDHDYYIGKDNKNPDKWILTINGVRQGNYFSKSEAEKDYEKIKDKKYPRANFCPECHSAGSGHTATCSKYHKNMKENVMAESNGYIAFYKGNKIEVNADTSYKAQLKATDEFKKKYPKIKSYDVTVKLAEVDGKQVTTHSESIIRESNINEKILNTRMVDCADCDHTYNKSLYKYKCPKCGSTKFDGGKLSKDIQKESNVSKVLSLLEGANTVTIEKSDGEYRVPAEDGYEDGAHYTDDKGDAEAVAKKVFGKEVVIKYRSVPEFVGGKYEKYRPKK